MKPIPPDDPSNPSAVERLAGKESEREESDSERRAIARARQGDAQAFRELVDRHRDRAYGLALRVVRSEPDAEEVAQDAFVRAWLALPTFRGESKFGTWLYAIVMRRALDRAATLKRRRERETDLESSAETASDSGGALPGERVRIAFKLERMMDRLTEAQRAVVTLFYYEERSVEQVSEALAMPTGTV